jgi:hypothetical protein
MRLLIIATALSLSACVAVEDTPATPAAAKPKIPSGSTSSNPDNQTTSRTPNGGHKTFAPLSPDRVIGQNKEALLRLLGTPGFKRRDPPAEIWRYRDQSCLLDLYLYPSQNAGTGSPMKVTFIEARTTQGPSAPAAKCLNTIRSKFVTKAAS